MLRMHFALVSALALVVAACSGPTNPQTATPAAPAAQTPAAVAASPTSAQPVAPRQTDVERFERECRLGLTEARARLDTILAAEGDRTYENTLVPYDEMIMHMENSWGVALLMRNVHPDDEIRSAAEACEQEVVEFASSLGLNRDLYQAFAALDPSGFDPLAQRLVAHTLRDFRRTGVDKDEATRTRIAELDAEISKIAQQFSRNIADDVRTVRLDPAQLAGMPQDWIDAHPVGEDGKVAVTTNYPDYLPFSTYAEDGEARRALYMAFRSRGAPANDEVLRKLLQLRWEKAQLLGYDDFADYYIEDKMMKTGAAAQKFIDRVYKLAKARANKDYKKLIARKRKDDHKARRVEDWEKTYYEEKIKAEQYEVDAKQVRQYFEYSAVEQGLLDITAEMYGVQYVRVDDPRSWHEDVKVFDVMQQGDKIGRIFLDMHPREGKYGHAAKFPIATGVAGKQLPEAALVCNFPNPRTASGPALMEHGDVETMFHEFGHLMHHVFGGHIPYAALSSTERDFVEAPSQMFEEWAWNHETLSRFARHHETGEVIPADLVAKMRRADEFGLGTETTFQLFYAALVLQFYQVDPETLDFYAKSKQLQERYTPFRYIDGIARHASFGHLSGYPASYYTYMWSLVLAKDLLSPFGEHGLMNREWTQRYRDKVLAPAGSKDAAQLIEDFLGRPYDFKAFERYIKG